MKYCDKNLKPPLLLSTHIMGGRVKILETYSKSEEILSFYPIFHAFTDFVVKCLAVLPCFHSDTLYPQSHLSTHKMEGKT